MSPVTPCATRLVAFADLDDTLLQTLRKRDVPGSVVAGLGRDGLPLSYACPKQQKLFACLLAQGAVIPTTARDFGAFQRIQLPFSSFAILNFGATLLNPDRTLNEDWHTRMASLARVHHAQLVTQLEAALAFSRTHGLDLNIRMVSDFDVDWYVLAKHTGQNPEALDSLHRHWVAACPPGFTVRRNDNNLTLSPDFFDKKHAVLEVIAQHFDRETDVFLGLGDSLSDFDFMSACDYLVLPSNSQLHRSMPGANP